MAVLPEDGPQTRNEMYLASIAGEEVELPPEGPQTRNEQYLAYIAENGSGDGDSQWRLLQAVTLEEEVQEINIDLKSLGCSEYRIQLETPAPGESSTATTYVAGWMYDESLHAIFSGNVNSAFWDTYPGANNESVCVDLMSMPTSNDFVALRVKGAWGSNVSKGKPLTSYKDSGWMKNPNQDVTGSELDDSGHTPFRGFKLFRYRRKCIPGTQYFVWGR